MLTISCTGGVTNQGPPKARCLERSRVCSAAQECCAAPGTRGSSLHVIRHPVLRLHHGGLGRVPVIDAIVLATAEVVGLAPLDRAAAQALRIDLHGLER